ncbi:MAG: FAD-dependent oxidoreductase [Actinomycetota bacterium]|nr:FAD-dependent oxidoreductase [Actinomycetota bacterium]
MTDRRPTFVIVGANLTGGAAVSTLRDHGFHGRIILIGQEQHPPYERPPLSKGYLRGEEPFDDALLRPPNWYGENDVELLLGTTATRVDPGERVVELADGNRIPYDKVLVATGGRNRRLPVPGGEPDGVLYLRTVEDSDALKAEAKPGRKAAVVGAGFIGSEVAASLRTLGVEVEVVEVFDAPLVRVVGPEIGKLYESIHRDHGVRFHFQESVERFEGTTRVEEVITSKGTRIACDLAVVGVGIQPATEVVEGTDVAVENGILVDEFCRTTVDGVFAAGDVANHYHPLFGRRMRVEHWDNALKQGAAAARNMMGRETTFADPHWFWSDQYDFNLQYMGFATAWDEFVVRGSLEDRNFVGFYVKDGVVDAVVGLNRGRDVRRSAGLIQSRQPVDPAVLRDEDGDLKKLAQSLSRQGA